MPDPLRQIRTDCVLVDTRTQSHPESPGRYVELLVCGHRGSPIWGGMRVAAHRRCALCGGAPAAPDSHVEVEVAVTFEEALAAHADWAAWHERRHDPSRFARRTARDRAVLGAQADRHQTLLDERRNLSMRERPAQSYRPR